MNIIAKKWTKAYPLRFEGWSNNYKANGLRVKIWKNNVGNQWKQCSN